MSVPLSGNPPLVVQPGEKLAIVLSLDSPTAGFYDWIDRGGGSATGPPPYAAGGSFNKQIAAATRDPSWMFGGYWRSNDALFPQSAAFRTYVSVPEPGFASLSIPFMAALCVRRKTPDSF